MMEKPDLLIFMTDQHTPYYSGWLGGNVDTPNMDRLCEEGTRFDQAYTSCPLCVPARTSMLSGLLPHRTGVFTNQDALADTQATFLHSLVQAGYDTVLCGRMHFIGADQRHGFTKRIAPDMSPTGWSSAWKLTSENRGVFATTYGAPGATAFAGGGESPVLYYDEAVTQAALAYLSKPHERPQCIVVGLYAPHFPYVAPKALFQKYYERAQPPALFEAVPPYMNELLLRRRNKNVSPQKARAALAAYCGMIERVDEQLGRVRRAFDDFVRSRGTRQLFCYLSDHGDQVGDRGIYGKDTFFEKSVKVPMIFAGDGIMANRRVDAPVSLMDVGPTLCDWAGAQALPETDGVSQADVLRGAPADANRIVLSELLELVNGSKFDPRVAAVPKEYAFGVMARAGDYKYIAYHGYNEMLFDMRNDPQELCNLVQEHPAAADRLRAAAHAAAQPEQVEAVQKRHDTQIAWFAAVEKRTGRDDSELWLDNPPSARGKPEICIDT